MGSVGTFSPTNWLKVHGPKTVKLHFGYRYVFEGGQAGRRRGGGSGGVGGGAGMGGGGMGEY